MNLSDKVSQAVQNSKLYNLNHFHEAWENPDVRRLMGNELLYPPSPHVIEAVKAIIPFVNYYPEDAPTNKKLLNALAGYVGIDGGSDWITLGNGSMEIIDMVPHAFINPGDEILLPAPEYSPYSRRPLIYGAKIVDVIPDSNYVYSLEDFTSKITAKTKMVIMSRPNASNWKLGRQKDRRRIMQSPIDRGGGRGLRGIFRTELVRLASQV